MAQTAVEWLITLCQQTNKIDMFDLEVAKEIEKKQISKAWDAGKHQYFSMGIPEIEFNNGDEYYNINYNETYGKD